jgi:predicted ferric reductase
MKIRPIGFAMIDIWIALYMVIIGFYYQTPFLFPFSAVARILALLGTTSLFNASIISTHMTQIYRSFNTPFLKLHHLFAITGFCLIIAHPISVISYAGIIAVYTPGFEGFPPDLANISLDFVIVGTIALCIVFFSIIAIILKKSFEKYWRFMHGFIYLAIWLGIIHGVILGEDLAFNAVLQFIFVSMGLFLGFSFSFKRFTRYRAKKEKNDSKLILS